MVHFDPWTRARLFARSCGIALLCLTATLLGAQSQRADEYDLKAAVIYNILLYVTWPDTSFDGSSAPIVVGVVGKDPFGTRLEQTFTGKRVNGRAVVVKRFATRPRDAECQLLFFAGGAGHKALGARTTAPVLTMGESREFALSGGMVQIDIVGGRGVLTINLGTVRDSGLQVSSKLLKVAKVIRGGSH